MVTIISHIKQEKNSDLPNTLFVFYVCFSFFYTQKKRHSIYRVKQRVEITCTKTKQKEHCFH